LNKMLVAHAQRHSLYSTLWLSVLHFQSTLDRTLQTRLPYIATAMHIYPAALSITRKRGRRK